MLPGLYLPLYTTYHAEDRRNKPKADGRLHPHSLMREPLAALHRQDRFVYGTQRAIFIVLLLVILLTFGF